MKIYTTFSMIVVLTTLAEATPINSQVETKSTATKPANQAKRDISLSYAATNIDSKEGTRVKTITVIKNHSGKSDQKLAIDPELHKNDEWATAFRDNFDSFGAIPDVPDIDDLFEFVKKKPTEKKEEANKTEAPKMKMKAADEVKPIEEPSSDDVTTMQPVQKIKDAAEVITGMEKNQTKTRSQSLDMEGAQYRREPLVNYNFTSPQHSMHHYFEKYVQEIPKGYDYAKPCVHGGKGSVSITNPSSGRTYDIPVEEDAATNPYIAPAFAKKAAVQPQSNSTQNVASTAGRPNYYVNSLLPSLQPTQGTFPGTALQQQQQQTRINSNQTLPQQVNFSTSQRPYLAPNIQTNNGFSVIAAPPVQSIYRSDISNFRRNNYSSFSFTKPNAARSRGLKY